MPGYVFLDEFDSGLPVELRLRFPPNGGQAIIEARLGPTADGLTRLVVEGRTMDEVVQGLHKAVATQRRIRGTAE